MPSCALIFPLRLFNERSATPFDNASYSFNCVLLSRAAERLFSASPVWFSNSLTIASISSKDIPKPDILPVTDAPDVTEPRDMRSPKLIEIPVFMSRRAPQINIEKQVACHALDFLCHV